MIVAVARRKGVLSEKVSCLLCIEQEAIGTFTGIKEIAKARVYLGAGIRQ